MTFEKVVTIDPELFKGYKEAEKEMEEATKEFNRRKSLLIRDS